ncbi:glycoside hydrolase family 47 protein [Patellaria atrata CBS 101060]|uniref:alpha-1,2-Mannosidase n=1 Tax=Patellaria atrata CBS 101060 TaxID=1346257 RepID=A0A9P4S4C7_9PEZI|nr:glycoside hydrolase family 47 protein [Patellaria atrata CBS 101060]
MPNILRRWTLNLLLALAVIWIYTCLHPYTNGYTRATFPGAPGAPGPGLGLVQQPSKWGNVPTRHPVQNMRQLPAGQPVELPQIQHNFEAETAAVIMTRETRRQAVLDAFKRCWKAYKEHAWMKDEVTPISGGSRDTFGGWAATLVDSLDTLWIMGLKEDFRAAVQAAEKINFGSTAVSEINVFETTIRYLGGFLAAYDLSGEKALLAKAIEVGELLYLAFDTPNRMPITRWKLSEAFQGKEQVAPNWILSAEIGSLTVEFTRLSQLTGDQKYYDAVSRIVDVFADSQNKTLLRGMWPIAVNPRDKDFTWDTTFSLGAMSDSLYEYFPKTYALTGGRLPIFKQMFETSMNTAAKHLLFRPLTPDNANILVSGIFDAKNALRAFLKPQGQHLVCFTGGMYALGGRIFQNDEYVKIGRKLTDGCIWTYKSMPHGIMPEVFHIVPCPDATNCQWNEAGWKETVRRHYGLERTDDIDAKIKTERLPKGFLQIDDGRYILRPEAIESVFILYRITGDKNLQDAAWDMFTAIIENTSTHLANAAIADVSVPGEVAKMDSMESFWLAETLKYFYLIFSDPKIISLDDYVFNTEAHPFKIPKPVSGRR